MLQWRFGCCRTKTSTESETRPPCASRGVQLIFGNQTLVLGLLPTNQPTDPLRFVRQGGGEAPRVEASPLPRLGVFSSRRDQFSRLSARKSLVSSHQGADQLHGSAPALLHTTRPSAAA